jgi:hypothetical protein
LAASKATSKKEAALLLKQGLEHLSAETERALALNPKSKPVKKKPISVSMKKKRTSLSASSSWRKRI